MLWVCFDPKYSRTDIIFVSCSAFHIYSHKETKSKPRVSCPDSVFSETWTSALKTLRSPLPDHARESESFSNTGMALAPVSTQFFLGKTQRTPSLAGVEGGLPVKNTRFGFCEQVFNFSWAKTLRFWAVVAAGVTSVNTLHLCPIVVVCQEMH